MRIVQTGFEMKDLKRLSCVGDVLSNTKIATRCRGDASDFFYRTGVAPLCAFGSPLSAKGVGGSTEGEVVQRHGAHVRILARIPAPDGGPV